MSQVNYDGDQLLWLLTVLGLCFTAVIMTLILSAVTYVDPSTDRDL
jgi:hypothetical protein